MPVHKLSMPEPFAVGRALVFLGCVLAVVVLCMGVGVSVAGAAPSAWSSVSSRMVPSNLSPGGEATIFVQAVNVGDGSTSGRLDFSDVLPAGVSLLGVQFFAAASGEFAGGGGKDLGPGGEDGFFEFCRTTSGSASCSNVTTAFGPPLELIEPLLPFGYLEMRLKVRAQPGAVSGTGRVQITGAGPVVSIPQQVTVSAAPVAFGVESFNFIPEEEGGGVDTQAGSHPFQLSTTITLNQGPDTLNPPATPRHLRFRLPAGFLGNTTALAQCDDLDFRHMTKGGQVDLCPDNTAVGVVTLAVNTTSETVFTVPIFNLVPKRGEPARFGFEVIGTPVTLDTSVRTGSDYGVTVDVNNISELVSFLSSTVTLWGVPGDVSHNASRGWGCISGEKYSAESGQLCERSSQAKPPPFLTMPSSCRAPFTSTVQGEAWPNKEHPDGASFPAVSYLLADGFGRELGIGGCERLPFEPSIVVKPDGEAASTPTGLTTTVRVPQEVNENGAGLASSSVRDITVEFPDGVTVNPASADGLQACSEQQVGFSGFAMLDPSGEPGVMSEQFTSTIGDPFCPDASKIGTVKIKVPVIHDPLEGSLYLATQDVNPFSSLVAMYIVAEDKQSGVLVKLPGAVALDPVTGRLTATFKNSPQAPLETAEIHLLGGDRAPLSTPTHCGIYTTNATFTPWSGTAPVSSQSQFTITTGPGAGACPPAALPFTPTLAAGSPNISAGSFSALVTTIGREDGNQNINKVQLHLAPGMSGILAGVPLCHEPEANAGTCPEASLIGKTIVSVGLGGDPFSVTGGKVYLTEKYGGAPFGLSIVNPAVAGPFDLGKVVVRATIQVDPRTAALTVTTGEIPHILDGIPLQIKHVNVTIDRQGFTVNPTNCNPLTITGTIGAVEGAVSPVSDPFQVTNCAALKFTPTVAVATAGKASKANGASLHFKIAYPKGALGSQSWFNEAKFDIPKQLPARLTTIQKACDSAIFEHNRPACPVGSKIGTAIVHTPVLPVPLAGPVYFVSYGSAKFPEAVLVLDGYGVHIELHGETFISESGVTSATFRNTPDVPFESIEVNLPTGPFSEFGANLPKQSYNFCGRKLVMPTLFKAQNGLEIKKNTPLTVTGCRKGKTNAQKLAAALKACHRKHGGKRASCERSAHKRFGAAKKAKKSQSHGKRARS